MIYYLLEQFKQKGTSNNRDGEQTGPDDFVLDGGTDYYVRVKYGTSDPEDTAAEWSTTTHFRHLQNLLL